MALSKDGVEGWSVVSFQLEGTRIEFGELASLWSFLLNASSG